jgi:hypothetical protein
MGGYAVLMIVVWRPLSQDSSGYLSVPGWQHCCSADRLTSGRLR